MGRGCRLSPSHASAISGTPRMTAPASLAGIMASPTRNAGCDKRQRIAPRRYPNREHESVQYGLTPYCTLRSSRPAPLGLQPRRAARFGQLAHAQDVALALGHRDDAAGVEQVEDVGG